VDESATRELAQQIARCLGDGEGNGGRRLLREDLRKTLERLGGSLG
jgi:hypothetical protein